MNRMDMAGEPGPRFTFRHTAQAAGLTPAELAAELAAAATASGLSWATAGALAGGRPVTVHIATHEEEPRGYCSNTWAAAGRAAEKAARRKPPRRKRRGRNGKRAAR
jgi:hypothetical protein